MMRLFIRRFVVVLLVAKWAVLSCGADTPTQPTNSAPVTTSTTWALTNQVHVVPGFIDGRIAFVTARFLEQYQYAHHPLDAEFASKLMDRYLEAFDPQKLHFLQSDLDEFQTWRTNLSRMTLTTTGLSDVTPATEIFNRFYVRLQQRVTYMDNVLKSEVFSFDGDERIQRNRKEASYPKDLNEAHQLWRERVRYDYLQEKLARSGSKPKTPTTTNSPAQTPPVTQSTPAMPPNPASLNSDSYELMRKALREQVAASQTAAQPKSPVKKAGKDSKTPKTIVEPKAPAAAPEKPVQPTTSVAAATNAPAPAVAKKSEAEEIADVLTHRYYRSLRTFSGWDNEDVLQIYLDALAHVYDPHSDYMGHQQLDQFAISMNLSLFGIGAELRSMDGICTIMRLLPGGPAVKSGLIKEGDQIVAVSQTNSAPIDIVEMDISKAVQLIRGPKGTQVNLTIIPKGTFAKTNITLVRDEVPLEEAAAKAKLIEIPGTNGVTTRIGVIDLPSFYAPFDTGGKDHAEAKSTTSDVTKLINKLKKENAQGIILDLRRNGGGSLEEAIRLAGLFIKKGPIVLVRDFQNHVQQDDDPDDSVVYDGPLEVLTSRFSASASEIVAGALQDYGRALLVGDSSTHGKGTVQQVNNLRPMMRLPENIMTNDPGALKITIKKFYRASGSSTQLKGVVPDIILPSIANESKEIGENSLESALPWDTIDSAEYEHLNRVEPYVAELRERSTQRIAADKDWAYTKEEINLFKKQQADKTVSLNERELLKEKDENLARKKAQDKERLARKKSDLKEYELTVKLAAEPGLPPALVRTNTIIAKTITNTPSSNTLAASMAGDDDEPDVHPPDIDVTLTEAEHILVDYLSVLGKK